MSSKDTQVLSTRIYFPRIRISNPAYCFLMAFAITAAAIFSGFIFLKIWPMGDETLLVVDSIHQYLPFYSVMHDKLSTGENLFYSFSGGFGFNFWTTIAYYLASPLNIFLRFVPWENVCDFMDYMILLKLALCGGCFSWYLNKRGEGSDRALPIAFGTAYGCSAFMIGYYYNIMWIDSIFVLPLVMYGIERITNGEKGILYCLSLFYGIWCNYYIGFMLCIFSVLYFITCEISKEKGSAKEYLIDFVKFGFLSLLAGGMASLMILPAYMGLNQSQSVIENSFPKNIEFFSSFFEVMKSHMAATKPIKIADTQAGQNIYCGIFVLPGVILYFLNNKISLRERISKFILISFFITSFSFNILNYIWHGFHAQNGLPNRFAFLYIAVILSMAYRSFKDIKETGFLKIIISFFIPIIFYTALLFTRNSGEEIIPYIISLLLLGMYLAITAVNRKFYGKITTVILSIAMILETGACAVYGMTCNGNVNRSFYINDALSYKKMVKETGDTEVFRSEIDRQHMRNASMYAGALSMVMFNSTMQQSVTQFCEKLGIESRMNKNGYYGVTKILNDIFGIKYVASPARKANKFYGMDMVAGYGPLDLYKNENALSIGFMTGNDIEKWDPSSFQNPFESQNEMIKDMTGIENLFVMSYAFDAKDSVTNSIAIPEGKQLYLYVTKQVDCVNISTPEYNREVNSYNDFIYPINAVEDDGDAYFTLTLEDWQDSVECQVWECDQDKYEKAVKILAENQMKVIEMDGNILRGEITCSKDGLLLLTIPFDNGWEIKVDGKMVEPKLIGGMFIGIKLDEGEHSLSMEYTPPGFFGGFILSVISLGFLALYVWMMYRRSLAKYKLVNVLKATGVAEIREGAAVSESSNGGKD